MSKQIPSNLLISASDYLAATYCRRLMEWRRFADVASYTAKLNTPVGEFYHALTVQDYRYFNRLDIGTLPYWMRPRAVHAIAFSAASVDAMASSELAIEALTRAKQLKDYFTQIVSCELLAVNTSLQGDHRKALSVLDSGLPVARHIANAHPIEYMSYLNSVAVELAANGLFNPARHCIQKVLACQAFAPSHALSAWRKTSLEIEALDPRPQKDVIYISPRIHKHKLRLVRCPMSQEVPQLTPEQIGVEIIYEADRALWSIAPTLDNQSRLKILNYILSFSARKNVAHLPA